MNAYGMSEIIALDVGMKRTGLAVAQKEQKIAFGLTTVDTRMLLKTLKERSKENQIDTFVIGLPKKVDNTLFEIEKFISNLINQLKENFPTTKIERIDERYTSKMAQKTLLESGLPKKKRQNKALLDEISAIIILQSYLEQI